MKPKSVVVVGAGIGGLTAAALLVKRGYQVTVYEQAAVTGGCASTFRRKDFIFDVGATQVAGLEVGGIHQRIFAELGLAVPAATYCDPSCAVLLPHESEPINIWRSAAQWEAERQRQFPNSESFWQFLGELFTPSWQFQARNPVLPPRNLWDLWQLTKAVRLDTLVTMPYILATVGDALRGFGLAHDRRLRTFLDLQLKLYSQANSEETALLYAATALGLQQEPLGLFHLKGSMQVLSDLLSDYINANGGQILLRHRVIAIEPKQGTSQVQVHNLKSNAQIPEIWWQPADHVIANVTVNDWVRLLGKHAPKGYRQRVENLPHGSVAFVVYLGVDRAAIPDNCPPHLQMLERYEDESIPSNSLQQKPHSLFISVSQPGDGRAPDGKATIIASEFTKPDLWWNATADYQQLKTDFTARAIAQLKEYFDLDSKILYQEAATPRTFARYTNRERGIVGGVGMRVNTFGPFGFANRTPFANIWLVGDSTHPGEGTAGVSYSALTTVRQIEAQDS
jgi:C-3',4' desaturase CrtD